MKLHGTWSLGLIFALLTPGLAWAEILDVNLAPSGAVLSGYWPEATVAGRVYVGGSNGSQVDARVVGTTVDVTCYASGANCITVTVDGATSTPTFKQFKQWTTLTISLGSSGPHNLTIKQAFLGFPFYLDTGTGSVHGPTFSVHGAAPAVGPPVSGFGPQYQLSDPANVAPFVQFEGGLEPIAGAGYPSIYECEDFPDEGIYFTATAKGIIRGWIYGSGALLTVYQDGVNVGTITAPLDDTFQWVKLFKGDGSPHRYGVVSSYPRAPGQFIWSLMIAKGSLSQVPTIARPRLLTYGDSIALGYIGTGYDSAEALSQRLGADLGWAVFNRGVIGSTVHEFPSGDPTTTTDAGEARTSVITSDSAGARGVLVIYGTNDMNQDGGPETIAQFQSSYQAMLTNIVAGVPSGCPVLCVGILPRTRFSPTTIATWNAAIQAAISAVGAPNVLYADPSGWGLLQDNGPTADYTDTANNTSDGLNPNAQGYSIILPYITSYFAPAGAPTVTSATSGTAQIGEPIAYQATASNSPDSFAVGHLPAGLTLDAATGLISGIPTASGMFTLRVAATNASGTGSEAVDLTIERPVVTISVTVGEVTVNGGEYGEFALKLSSARASDLKVNYLATGGAIPGTDYAALPGFATIKAGATRAIINIKPLGNLNGASSKIVKLKLEPGKDYSVGTQTAVKVKILAGQ